ncbi:hypothetical protein MICAC_4220011 [Microcystis aeruginosa PCC 9443]|uniref:Uncharacterized protein n=1 Tax=Microcystis aeruginosa PCC 9443 TaxID=1160281 RepID=I4G5I6_MICAE|nr:hypothetical protein MICAC_4220011 [Microcystis aeruginosa PCC 9443]
MIVPPYLIEMINKKAIEGTKIATLTDVTSIKDEIDILCNAVNFC